MKGGRFDGADGIRGLACLTVLCTHLPAFFIPEASKYVTGTGKYGVWLFFVLSAFLLTSKFQRNGFCGGELLRYALSRCLRILPLFIVVVLIYWQAGVLIATGDDAWRAISFQEGYGHLWTIPVEFTYYALLPGVAWAQIRVKQHGGATGVFLFTLALIVAHQLVWPYWDTAENSIQLRWYLPCFFMGGYVAVSMDAVRTSVRPGTATLAGLAALLVLLALTPGGRHWLLGMPFDSWLQNKFVLIGLVWAVFLAALADGKGLLGAVLQTRGFRLLGAWSYSIYLIHWLVYSKLAALGQGGVAVALVALAAAVAGGALLYYLIEAPIERLRRGVGGGFRVKQASSA